MNKVVYPRFVNIPASSSSVLNYVSKVDNLPKWTSFFIDMVEHKDDKYKMLTKMGISETHIEVEGNSGEYELRICSKFETKSDSARIKIKEHKGYTTLIFELALPEEMPEEKARAMVQDLETELQKLKTYLG